MTINRRECNTCCSVYTVCDKCGMNAHRWVGGPVQLPPPYGSLSAAAPITLCQECHHHFIAMSFRWMGNPQPVLPELQPYGEHYGIKKGDGV